MSYIYSCHMDIGNTRQVNQDAVAVKSAQMNGHSYLLAVICDGVGGLSSGELASRKAAEMASCWFDYELPQILSASEPEKVLPVRIRKLLLEMNQEIYQEGFKYRVSLGTTVSLLFLYKYQYYIGHVGDSRIYWIGESVIQLTKDHSWTAHEVELGNITCKEALHHPKQNVILQCIGAGMEIEPQLIGGEIKNQTSFVLCTDGFWHFAGLDELQEKFYPKPQEGSFRLGKNLKDMIETVKQRGEKDNIAAVALTVY